MFALRDPLVGSARAGRYLWIAVLVCAVATLIGVIAVWPQSRSTGIDPLGLDSEPIAARVINSTLVPCSYDPFLECRLIGFDVRGGPEAGEIRAIEVGAENRIAAGDEILVLAYEDINGNYNYVFYEFERSMPMLVLFGLFAAAVLLLGRWRGLGALFGLGVSLAIIITFTLPSLLSGNNTMIVALVTAAAVGFITLFMAHGVTLSTAVALLSTFATMVLIVALGWFFVLFTKLTGFADESATLLVGFESGVDVRGILLAGLVIGALGVLDDVTVTQVSAVWELKRARPDLKIIDLYRPALRIGRDHISSTVNTLFLAYAGAALPLLLLFNEASQNFGSVINREIIAAEVVRALVGSIGLVASVPISTYLAAWLLSTSTSKLEAPSGSTDDASASPVSAG
jgi:uncharacterized membrane protein